MKYQYTVGQGARTFGSCRQAHPVRTTYKIASTIRCRGCFSRLPPFGRTAQVGATAPPAPPAHPSDPTENTNIAHGERNECFSNGKRQISNAVSRSVLSRQGYFIAVQVADRFGPTEVVDACCGRWVG